MLPQVIASVLMLTREISDNKTLTIKSSYPMEYQATGKRNPPTLYQQHLHGHFNADVHVLKR